MLFLLPFLILLLVLFFTKNNIIALFSALLSSFFVYINLFNITTYHFLIKLLPIFFLEIISPSGYLYPLLFLLLVACIINIFEDLQILNSYSILLNSILLNMRNKIIDVLILFSPLLFFIDDYLIMFGVKSFFLPLLVNEKNNKNELSFYTINIAAGGSVLFFFSTWTGIITNQIQNIQKNIISWQELSAITIFLESKKYFIFPIIVYISLFFYIYLKKKNELIINKKNIHQSIIWSDIFIFLLLPFSIAINFLYKLYILSIPIVNLDVAFVMFEGISWGSLIIIFFLFLYKSISYTYIINSIFNTLLGYKKTVISLLICWLFSKITLLCLQLNFNFIIPSYLISFYPIIYFLISLLVAFILGSEWGTLSIMIPLIVCIKNYHNLYLILGAIVSGVISGAQLSPVSNTSTTVSAVFEVDSLTSYLYRIKYLLYMILISAGIYFLLGYFL